VCWSSYDKCADNDDGRHEIEGLIVNNSTLDTGMRWVRAHLKQKAGILGYKDRHMYALLNALSRRSVKQKIGRIVQDHHCDFKVSVAFQESTKQQTLQMLNVPSQKLTYNYKIIVSEDGRVIQEQFPLERPWCV